MSLRRAASDSEYSSSEEESVDTGDYYDTDLTDSELEEVLEEEVEEEEGEASYNELDHKLQNMDPAEAESADSCEKGGSERGDGETKVEEVIVPLNAVEEQFDAEGDDEKEGVVTVVKNGRGTAGETRKGPKAVPPYEVPKHGRFYMHDDRVGDENRPRKSRRPRRLFDPDARNEQSWPHDGYEQLVQGEQTYSKRRSRRSRGSSGSKSKESSRRERRSKKEGKERSSKKEGSALVRGRWSPERSNSSQEDVGRTSHVLVVDKTTGKTIKKEVSIKDGSLRRSIRRNSRSSWASASKTCSQGEPTQNTRRSRRYLASKGLSVNDESNANPSSESKSKPVTKQAAHTPRDSYTPPPPPPPPPPPRTKSEPIPKVEVLLTGQTEDQSQKEDSVDLSSLNVNAAQFEPGKTKLSVSARPYQPSVPSPPLSRPPPPQYVIGPGPPLILPVQQPHQQYRQPYVFQQGNTFATVPVFYDMGQQYVDAYGYQGARRDYGGNRRMWIQKHAGET